MYEKIQTNDIQMSLGEIYNNVYFLENSIEQLH